MGVNKISHSTYLEEHLIIMEGTYCCDIAQYYVFLKQHLTLYSENLFNIRINKTINYSNITDHFHS